MSGPEQSRSLARELTFSLVTLVAAVVVALSSSLYLQLSQDMLEDIERKADEYSTRLTDILSIPMWNFDARTLEQIGAVFAQYDLVNELSIRDVQGRTLFILRKADDPDATIMRQHDVHFEGEVIGHVSMAFTLKAYRASLRDLAKAAAAIVGVVVVVLFTATGILLRVLLRRPLDALQTGMDRIAQGDFSYDVRSIPHVELSHIAENFARMAHEVELRERELHAINDRLQQEIAVRRSAEEALRTSEERYALAVRGTSDGIWDWDLRTGDVYFAPRWKSIIGYEDHELPNAISTWKDNVHPDDMPRVIEANESCMRREVPEFQVEYRMRHKDGSWCWVLGRGAAIWDEQGNALRMAGAHTDITGWKATEQALREAKNTLDNVINAMPSTIVGLDQHGRVTLWNLTAANDTGLAREQVMGHGLEEVLPRFAFLSPDVTRCMNEGRTIAMQKVSLPQGVGQRHYDIVILPVVTRGAYGAVLRIDDVTARMRIEEIMVQTEKMLSVGGLAAGMAHEINNPLGGILQGAQNIMRRIDPTLPANRKAAEESGCDLENLHTYMTSRGIIRFLEGIRESGQRAASIVSNMLEFSRSSDSRWSRVAIPHLVERTLELAANDYDLKKKYDFRHIEIVQDFAPDLPEVLCMPTEIEQVLLNLFKNAAQAMPERGQRADAPRITVRGALEGDRIRLDVADNGPGMVEDVRRRVFEPFYTTKNVGEGTGLGLSVSYFIITTNHGGSFSVQSEPGSGTMFSIRLPLTQPGMPRNEAA